MWARDETLIVAVCANRRHATVSPSLQPSPAVVLTAARARSSRIVGNFKPRLRARSRTAYSVRLNIVAARAAEPPDAICWRRRSVSSSDQGRLMSVFGMLAKRVALYPVPACEAGPRPGNHRSKLFGFACSVELARLRNPPCLISMVTHPVPRPKSSVRHATCETMPITGPWAAVSERVMSQSVFQFKPQSMTKWEWIKLLGLSMLISAGLIAPLAAMFLFL